MPEPQSQLAIPTLGEKFCGHGAHVARHRRPVEGLRHRPFGGHGGISVPASVHGDHSKTVPEPLGDLSPKRGAKAVGVMKQGKGAVSSPILQGDLDASILQAQTPADHVVGNQGFRLGGHDNRS